MILLMAASDVHSAAESTDSAYSAKLGTLAEFFKKRAGPLVGTRLGPEDTEALELIRGAQSRAAALTRRHFDRQPLDRQATNKSIPELQEQLLKIELEGLTLPDESAICQSAAWRSRKESACGENGGKQVHH